MSGESTNSTDRKSAQQEPVNESKDAAATEAPENTAQDPGVKNQAADPGDEIEQLRQQVEQQKQVVAESREKVLRAQAELDNMRKRTTRDIENAHKYALEKFISELLPVMDSLELGLTASTSSDDLESLKEGMDLTKKKFAATLEKFGVRVIDPLNEKFNPELHEAVSMQEQQGVESGTVISVMQKGYELNGRLVRPAMVIVAK